MGNTFGMCATPDKFDSVERMHLCSVIRIFM